MAIDWQNLLYKPVHNVIGDEDGLLTPNDSTDPVTLTVISKLEGIAVERGAAQNQVGAGGFNSLLPACVIRYQHLVDNGLTLASLDGGSIQFNGKAYRIESHQPKPAPTGEADGEVLLFLTESTVP